ncbi:MAG: TRAP transporter TatT component family protein [Bacteroidota bacterium]
MRIAATLACAGMFLFSGCVQTIAVNTVGNIVDQGFSAFTEDTDLAFVEEALPANIKLLEVLLKNNPTNEKLLMLTSEGYSSYALAFLEDKDPVRAREFYLRGKDYGMRMLTGDKDLANALNGPVDELKALLATRGRETVPGAFWTAFGWGNYIYLSLQNTDAIADLPRAEALMQFVAEKDSSYYFAGADLFLGTLYGSRPKIFGGNPQISRQHFERALRITKGKLLLAYVYYARSYAVQTQDQPLFEELLSKVDTTSVDVLPEFRLGNAIAKEKAKVLRAKEETLF